MTIRRCEEAKGSNEVGSVAAASPVLHVDTEAQDDNKLDFQLEQIPSLIPWTTYVGHDDSLSDEMNKKLAANVRSQVLAELRGIFVRLQKQQREREAAGVLSPRAARTMLEGRLVVEAKRGIHLDQIVENTKMAMLAAKAMAEQVANSRNYPARGVVHGSYSSDKNATRDHPPTSRAWRRGSVAVAAMNLRKAPSPKRKGTESKDTNGSNTRWGHGPVMEDDLEANTLFSSNAEPAISHSDQSEILCVNFPPRDPRTLSEALDEFEANLKDKKARYVQSPKDLIQDTPRSVYESDNHHEDIDNNIVIIDEGDDVTGFWRRSVPESAVQDASSPVSRRDPPSDRVRYIMSTRLGALPPTKRILEEYPIPKEIMEALERHRHFHVDAFSFESSFDPIRVSTDTTESCSNGANHGWECYIRRSVPMERKPVSFVLASLAVAREQPVPPPSDIFHQHVLAAARSEAAMLAEVRQLYDHVHDAYREFRSTLHRNLDMSYLVDLAFRSSLNSISFFLEDDDGNQSSIGGIVPTEQTVKIPVHLQQRVAAIKSSASSSAASKWRLAKKGATGVNNRRGAIALNFKSEAATLVQRHEMINKLTTFSAQEVRLMELWHSHDPDSVKNSNHPGSSDVGEQAGLDPVAMPPALSARFEIVWRELQMPAEERLDLAIKYSSLSGSARLADAVVLWELSTALIKEREELLKLVRTTSGTTKKSSAVIATEVAMLQDLTASSTAIKEALMLTYVEVGDFVTYGGNFYLARMEYEATELRELVLQSIEASKRRPNAGEDAALSDGTKIGAQPFRRSTEADSTR